MTAPQPERFSASVASRHIECHASANLPLAIPGWEEPFDDRDADTAANRGTAKHVMLEPIMGLGVTEIEYMAKVLAYVAQVRRRRQFKVLVEEGVDATWLNATSKTTADLVLYVQDELHIIDYKWGKMPVPVVGNRQTLFYAASYRHLAPKATGVTLHIVQPYCDVYDSWFATDADIARFRADCRVADKAIQAGDTTFGPGDHCTFCPANPWGRGLKAAPWCAAIYNILMPPSVDEDEVLGL